MSIKKVSVIIPTFNRPEKVVKAIGSVLNQTFQDFEIVVVDDASTDNVAETLKPFIDDGLIRYICHKENQGAGASRNTGIGLSKGEYLAFLDSDDLWLPQKLEIQLKYLEQHDTNAWACSTGFEVHGTDGQNLSTFHSPLPLLNIMDVAWGCSISPGSTLLIKKELLLATSLFDPTLRRLEDWDWLLHFIKIGKVCVTKEILCKVAYNKHLRLEDIKHSIPVLFKRHFKNVPGIKQKLIFFSSLMLEKSAGYYRSGEPLRAILFTAISICSYPFRNLFFFVNIFQKFKNTFISSRPVEGKNSEKNN